MYESNPVDDSFSYSEGTYNLLIIKYQMYISYLLRLKLPRTFLLFRKFIKF